MPYGSASAVGGVIESSSKAGDSLTITFRGGGLNLYAQRSPNAGQVYLTVDGREASHVPIQVQGRSLLNLNGSDKEAPVVIPITDGLGAGQHVLRVVVGSASGTEHGPVVIAGFEVKAIDRFSTLLKAAVAVGVAVISAVILLLSLRAWLLGS